MSKFFWKTIWLIVIVAFVVMEIYHFIIGNYQDMLISLSLVVIALFILFMIKFFKEKRD